MNAKFVKLHNGRWGIEVDGHVSAGQPIAVTKRNGDKKKVKVGRIIWGGKDRNSGLPLSLCTIQREPTHEDDRLDTDGQLACANCGQPFAEHLLSWAVDASGVRDKVCTHCEGPGYALSFA